MQTSILILNLLLISIWQNCLYSELKFTHLWNRDDGNSRLFRGLNAMASMFRFCKPMIILPQTNPPITSKTRCVCVYVWCGWETWTFYNRMEMGNGISIGDSYFRLCLWHVPVTWLSAGHSLLKSLFCSLHNGPSPGEECGDLSWWLTQCGWNMAASLWQHWSPSLSAFGDTEKDEVEERKCRYHVSHPSPILMTIWSWQTVQVIYTSYLIQFLLCNPLSSILGGVPLCLLFYR